MSVEDATLVLLEYGGDAGDGCIISFGEFSRANESWLEENPAQQAAIVRALEQNQSYRGRTNGADWTIRLAPARRAFH